MLPDLSPHLHTEECNFLIQLMHHCFRERKFGNLKITFFEALI